MKDVCGNVCLINASQGQILFGPATWAAFTVAFCNSGRGEITTKKSVRDLKDL